MRTTKWKNCRGQLLMDIPNCLPGVLKRRYLDYLEKLGLDLSRRGFESLRKFVVKELSIMTSAYTKLFLNRMTKKSSPG